MRSPVLGFLIIAAAGMVVAPCPGQRISAVADSPIAHPRSETVLPVSLSLPTLRDQEEDVRPTSSLRGTYVGIGAGFGLVSIGDFYGLTEMSASLALPLGEDEVGVAYLMFQHAPIQRTSRLIASLEDGVMLLGVGGDFRFYRTPLYTFIGHYLSAGVGVHLLSWKYLHELELPQYDENDNFTGYERVQSDVIVGFDLHAGLGLDIGQVWDAHLEAEITPGVMFWSGKSTRGFSNDLFKPFLYLKARMMARIAL